MVNLKKPPEECEICGKTEPLEEVLWYCEKCKKYYCHDCAIIYEGEASYAAYTITTYVKCPELYIIGKY